MTTTSHKVLRPAPQPLGPRTLYRAAWREGYAAQVAGADELSCPYLDASRPFTRRAWCDGWRAAAHDHGAILPADLEPDESTPPPS